MPPSYVANKKRRKNVKGHYRDHIQIEVQSTLSINFFGHWPDLMASRDQYSVPHGKLL